jgi:transcriptional regulator with XRE-family HTH domain
MKYTFSSAQCRAARGLLDISQSEVARSANITAGTIGGFERDERVPGLNNLLAIRAALEAAGIVFVPANGGGPGVRLRATRQGDELSKTMFSPDLSRAARNLLNLSQDDLADAAGIARSTVAEFERGARVPLPDNLTAIRVALESAGVAFIAPNGGGPGVRLRR